MSAAKTPATRGSAIRGVFENPMQLRLAITVLFLTGWYFLIYAPLSGEITLRSATIKAERDRLEMAKVVDHLRQEASRVRTRLPEDSDGNEWIEFLMNQVRKYPIKLVSLDPKTPTEVGPYKVITFRITVEGRYSELEKLLRAIETSPRILRVELVKLAPKADDGATKQRSATQNIELQLNVLGLINNKDLEKPESKGSSTRT